MSNHSDRPQLLFVFAGPGPPGGPRRLGRWLKAAKYLGLTCMANTSDDPQAWRGWVKRDGAWRLICSGVSPDLPARVLAESLGPGETGLVLPRGMRPEE